VAGCPHNGNIMKGGGPVSRVILERGVGTVRVAVA
jgi:hypothetical protein